MSGFDPVSRLQQAGVMSNTGEVPAGFREALQGLSEEETNLIISIDERLRAALPDVTPHDMNIGGHWF